MLSRRCRCLPPFESTYPVFVYMPFRPSVLSRHGRFKPPRSWGCVWGALLLLTLCQPLSVAQETALSEQEMAELVRQAEKGDAEAQFQVALAHDRGLLSNGRPNTIHRDMWLAKAAAQGHREACVLFIQFLKAEPRPLPAPRLFFAIGVLSKPAESGSLMCQTELADLLMASNNVPARRKALEWLEKAVAANYPPALVLKGGWLELGEGMTATEMGAARCYLKAVMSSADNVNGSYEAAERLARLYLSSSSLKSDPLKAELWLRHACYGGQPQNLAHLAILLCHHPIKERRSVEEAEALALEAEAGSAAEEVPLEILFARATVLAAQGDRSAAFRYVERAIEVVYRTSTRPPFFVDLLALQQILKKGAPLTEYMKRDFFPGTANPDGEVLENEIINDDSTYLRRWHPVPPSGLADPMPVTSIPRPLPLENPTWTGNEPQIFDEWGEQVVTLPTLLPVEEMELFPYQAEGEALVARARSGDSDALREMALRFMYVLKSDENEKTGLDMLKQLAARGHAPSLTTLGHLYAQGHPLVGKDDSAAFRCYDEAGMAGDPEGLYHAARCYAFGLGTAAHPLVSHFRLRRAAVLKHPGAQGMLGRQLIGQDGKGEDPAQGMQLLLQAAGSGDGEAQMHLAAIYENSADTQVTAMEDAHFWALRAARQEVPRAQFLVAIQFLEGRGCKPDHDEARQYLLASAQNYFVPAMRLMAIYYREGRHLPADPQRAEAWLRRAAHNGNALDLANLAEFLVREPGPSKSRQEEARRLMDQALEEQGCIVKQGELAEFMRVAARALASLKDWNNALDYERSYLAQISRMPAAQKPDFESRVRQPSLERQQAYMRGEMPALEKVITDEPLVRPLPLPGDTILQESEDKLAPPASPRPQGPGWDIPWGAEAV